MPVLSDAIVFPNLYQLFCSSAKVRSQKILSYLDRLASSQLDVKIIDVHFLLDSSSDSQYQLLHAMNFRVIFSMYRLRSTKLLLRMSCEITIGGAFSFYYVSLQGFMSAPRYIVVLLLSESALLIRELYMYYMAMSQPCHAVRTGSNIVTDQIQGSTKLECREESDVADGTLRGRIVLR